MSGELEASLYLSVTAFALTVGPTALKFGEAHAAHHFRRTLFSKGYEREQIDAILERPARWGLYSVLLFVFSGFSFLAYYLIPSQLLGPEYEPLFLGSLFLYVLAFCYFLILFASTTFSNALPVFDAAYMVSRVLKIGLTLSLIQWTVTFELIPAIIFAFAILSGPQNLHPFGFVFVASTIPSIAGTIIIVWAGINYLRGKGRSFSNRTLAISAVLFILPFLAYVVFFPLPSVL